MALTWDITEIENYQDLCWVENEDPNKKEGENFSLNPVTDALIHLSIFTGVPKITTKNYKELVKRLVELEILGIAVLPQEEVTNNSHMPSQMKRNPRPSEVKLHIGLKTNVNARDQKKWGNEVRRLVREQAEGFIRNYLEEDMNDDGRDGVSQQSDKIGDERVG
tara:strand:- start:5416 stop:5907 length:492 start_codon:yes stop_codon:yes gene_type:complete